MKIVNAQLLEPFLTAMSSEKRLQCLLNMADRALVAEQICDYLVKDITSRKLFLRFFAGISTIESIRAVFEEFGALEDGAEFWNIFLYCSGDYL